jgi:hypothetical protein
MEPLSCSSRRPSMPPPTFRYKKILNDDEIYGLYVRGHTLSQIAVIAPLPLKDVSDAIQKEQVRRGSTRGIMQK